MAFTYTDRNDKVVLHSWGRFKAVIGATVAVGDLLNNTAGNATSAMRLADDSDGYGAVAVACQSGVSGDEITCALAAELKAPTTLGDGGAATQTYFCGSTDYIGSPLYIGESGKVESASGTTVQQVGFCTARDTILLVPGGSITGAAGSFTTLAASSTTALTGATTLGASIYPAASDGAALGTSTYMFSDLFLASGAVINFNNGDVTLTHAANSLTFAGGCLNLFASGSEYAFTAGTPAFTMYTTNSSTSGSTSAEPFLVYNTQTGAAGVGGRARFYTTANVALGGWANALKAQFVFGASGRVSGLGSAFCAELQLSAGCTPGTYAVVECELVMDTNAVTGAGTAFINMTVSGAAKTTFDTSGYIFDIQGIADHASGKVFQANTAADATHALRIRINDTAYYIMLTTVGA